MSDPAEILAGLNPEQREAATAHDGPVLIVAGPGSGQSLDGWPTGSVPVRLRRTEQWH